MIELLPVLRAAGTAGWSRGGYSDDEPTYKIHVRGAKLENNKLGSGRGRAGVGGRREKHAVPGSRVLQPKQPAQSVSGNGSHTKLDR